MMDRYDSTYDPPAPIVRVEVYNPLRTVSKKANGKMDTGAYISVIPEDWIDEMRLIPAGEEEVSGYDGIRTTRLKYFVHVLFKGYSFFTDVISSPRTTVLLGRDLLNQLKVLLSGKEDYFDISDP